MSENIEIRSLDAFYGKAHVLQNIDLTIEAGRRTVIIGRNGMGKSTLLKSILGLSGITVRGVIDYRGENIAGRNTDRIARKGISYVPQGWQLFGSLTVEEHIRIAFRKGATRSEWNQERVYAVFPELRERRRILGTRLSGGEQQMLALVRALVANRPFVMMDEPSEGVSTLVLERIIAICDQLSSENVSLLLVEQNLELALRIADVVHILVNGAIVFTGPPDAIAANHQLQKQYLGI